MGLRSIGFRDSGLGFLFLGRGSWARGGSNVRVSLGGLHAFFLGKGGWAFRVQGVGGSFPGFGSRVSIDRSRLGLMDSYRHRCLSLKPSLSNLSRASGSSLSRRTYSNVTL